MRLEVKASDRTVNDNFIKVYSGEGLVSTGVAGTTGSPYQILNEKMVVSATGSTAVYAKLPDPANTRSITFVDLLDTATVFHIRPYASESIDGGTGGDDYSLLNTIRDSVTLSSDGTNWFIVASRIAP